MNIVSDIVVLDDDPTDLEITARFCRDAIPDSLIHQLKDSSELENTLQTVTPWMVLIDHFLGKSLGTDLIKELYKQYPDTAFVLVTGSIDQNIVCDAFRAGAMDYINKDDLSLNNIADLIYRVVQKRMIQDDARATISVLNDGIIRINEDGKIQRCNPAVEELLEETESELIGKSLDQYLSSRDRKILSAMFSLAGSDFEQPMEVTIINKNNKASTVEICVNSLLNGQQQKYIIVLRQISNTIQPLHVVQRNLVSVTSSGDYLGSSDIEGRIQFLNKAAQEFFSINSFNPETEPVQLQSLFADTMQTSLYIKIIPRLRAGGRWSGNGLLRGADNKNVPVSIMMNGLRNSEGEIDTIVFAMRELRSGAGDLSLHWFFIRLLPVVFTTSHALFPVYGC